MSASGLLSLKTRTSWPAGRPTARPFRRCPCPKTWCFSKCPRSIPHLLHPEIAVSLHGNGRQTPSSYYALLDSGADRTIFSADIAAYIGVTDIETGVREPTLGIAGQKTDVYYHSNLSIQIWGDDKRFPTVVGFSKDIAFPILGRSFFYHFQSVIFYEQKEQVELRPRIRKGN